MLTREQIDQTVDALTMGDVQDAFAAGTPDKAIAGVAFRRAAKRLGLADGKVDALDLVALGDIGYLAERVNAAMSTDNPKSTDTEG